MYERTQVKSIALPIKGLLKVVLDVHPDSRGFFVERFNQKTFRDSGVPLNFVQDNHSRSIPNVLRGLHFQTGPAQGKLVGVVSGKIFDVAVDLRPDSPTYGHWHGEELSGENGTCLWIPGGFAHGFCVLGNEPADVLYKVDAAFNPQGDLGIHWADPSIGIHWPIKNPIVSAKDEKLPSFADYKAHPVQW
jgi:dTDP-4-dehydrorhamnose 3,5-epimerase